MIIFNYVFLLTGVLFFTLKQFSADKPVYHCYRTNEPIIIDGVADDKGWEKAETAYFVGMDGKEPRLNTTFKWVWDENYLYGFFHLQDDHIWATLRERDAHLWNENVIEFFFDADGCPKSYFEFEVNPQNAVLDLYVLNKNLGRKDIRQWWTWDCEGMKNAVVIKGSLNNASDKDEYWDVEVAIPFSQIDTAPHIPPVSGDLWNVDFCRGEGEQEGGTIEYSAWAPPAFHNPLSYGIMVFK